MPKTYEPIATQTLGSSAATVTFTGISSAYTDCILIVNATLTAGTQYLYIRVGNGSIDSGSNYSNTHIIGDGTSPATSRQSNQTELFLGYLDTTRSTHIVQLQNYSNTTTNKSLLCRSNNTSTWTGAWVGLWRNTAAINQIQANGLGANFAAGSTFTLYGIKAA
jgi:hypothetical protein